MDFWKIRPFFRVYGFLTSFCLLFNKIIVVCCFSDVFSVYNSPCKFSRRRKLMKIGFNIS